MEDNILFFKENIANLETMEVKHNEEDLGQILLCSLPHSYVIFRDAFLYSRDILTIDELYDVFYSKEKMKHLVIGSEAQSNSLAFIKGR